MDPIAAIKAIQAGDRCAEHARAYNGWRRDGGFAAQVLLPWAMAYRLNDPNHRTRIADVDRVYRGHRGWRARVECRGGQGFRTVDVAALEWL